MSNKDKNKKPNEQEMKPLQKALTNSYYNKIVESKQTVNEKETNEIFKLLGTIFTNSSGTEFKYKIKENLHLTVVIIGAGWCMSSLETIKNLNIFQKYANNDPNDKQIDVIYVSLDPVEEQMMQILQETEDFLAIPFRNREQRLQLNTLFQCYQNHLPQVSVLDYECKSLQGYWLIDDIANYRRNPIKCIVKWRKLLENHVLLQDDSDQDYHSYKSEQSFEWDQTEKNLFEVKSLSKNFKDNRKSIGNLNEVTDYKEKTLQKQKTTTNNNQIKQVIEQIDEEEDN